MEKNISISILNSENIPKFFEDLNEVEKKLESLKIKESLFKTIIHFDVMDKKFVKNSGIDLKYIKIAKDMGFYADTHFMVSDEIIDKYIENAISYGTDDITIHYEIENFEETLNYLNKRKDKLLKEIGKNLIIGVAIKPDTNVEEILKYKNKFSKLLVMTVEPGYGGQKYIEKMNEKIKNAKILFPNHIIQIDGGVNIKTMEEPLRLGVDSFVMGTYLVKLEKEKLYDKIISLSIKKDIEDLPKNINMEFEKTILQIVPGGYAEHDEMVGINVPNIRKLSNKWYKYVNYNILDDYISSNYHEYRRFAVFCLSNKVKECTKNISRNVNIEENINIISNINSYVEKNIEFVNNWDLTDEVAPNITASYLENLKSDKVRKEKLNEYLNSTNTWKKRIGIVSMLSFAKNGNDKLVLWLIDKVLYEKYHLFQKASGWVLRELYKVKPEIVVNYLKENNKIKKIPNILVSYACEKMTKEEKNVVRLVK